MKSLGYQKCKMSVVKTCNILEPEARIELAFIAYEATVLPLNYSGVRIIIKQKTLNEKVYKKAGNE